MIRILSAALALSGLIVAGLPAAFLSDAARAEEAAPAPVRFPAGDSGLPPGHPAVPAASPVPAGPAPGGAVGPLPPPSVTSHVVEPAGRSLRFKATAGAIRLSDAQSGDPLADVGYVAFTREGDGQGDPRRPIAFVVNGGPGAASAWLNLGALGPWLLDFGGRPISPSAPATLGANAETWLDFVDLVFIDPPLTGYSRILAKGEDARRQLLSVDGDIDALSVVIRKWLFANGRRDGPVFIVGESYGGFRAPKLARRLQDDEGIGVRGLVLISPVLDFGWFEAANSPLPVMTQLPSLAAAARGLTPADGAALGEIEAFASGPYLTDLLRSERDPAARERLIAGVARFAGLDPAFARRLGGRIDPASFAREQGRSEAKIFSRYDMTVAGFDPSPHAADTNFVDPVLDAAKTAFAGAMTRLTADQLRWPVDARYEILNESVTRRWSWEGGRGRAQALTDLKQALAIDPNLRVLIVHGLTDLATPYFASKLLIGQIPPYGDADRLRLKLYEGGHMPWLRQSARAALREDARRLVEGE